MNTCPNPNSPEWKSLVEKLGEGQAMTAYTLNGNNTPTVEEAEAILGRLKVEEKDEQVSRSSDEFKLQRAVQQRTSLEKLKFQANPKQKQTLDQIIEMNDNYQTFLRNNIDLAKKGQPTVKTISVSNFIGSSDFNVDPKEYEAFKLFGTFMHEVLEIAQLKSLETGTDILDLVDQDFFKEAYDKYTAKNPFLIENLDEKEMLEMARQLAKLVSVNNNKGFMILPEITVTGTTRTGSTIIGRLDLLLVDTQGRVSIFDFKTKKVKNLVEFDPIGQPVENVNLAFVDMAGTSFAVSNKEGTAPAFRGQGRTAYDTWTLQLKVYENILKQSGLQVKEQSSSIVALMYQTDANKKYLGSAVHVFDENNYYNYAGAADVPNNQGHWVSDPTRGEELIKGLRKIVDTEIPTEETVEEERVQKEAKLLEFEPTKENNETLRASLENAINNELEEIRQKISELDQNKSNPALRELLAVRRSTLNDFNAIITRMSVEELGYSVNFSYAIDSVLEDLTKIANNSAEAMDTFKTNKDSFTSKQGLEITEAYKKSRALSAVVDTLTQIVREARENPDNKITADSEVMKKLSDMDSALAGIEANFAKVAMWNSVQVLQSPGVKTFTEVNKDVREVLEAKLKGLKEKHEKLKEGKAANIFQGMKRSMLSFVSKDYKQRLAEKLGDGVTEQMIAVEEIEREILNIEAILDGALNYDPEALEKYINGVTNSASDIYLGSNSIFNSNSFLSHILLDDKIASASNGSIEIAALTMMLKNAEGQARLEINNSLAALQFDQKRDKLLQRMSVEELNDKVSERRSTTILDKDGNEKEKSTLFMVKPFGQEYENTYRQFSIDLRRLNKEIYEAQKNFSLKFKTDERQEAENQLIAKKAERDEVNKTYIKWMLENAHLPFNEKFYQLQLQMPEEIRDELQKKYLEIETITYQVGKGNEALLEEADFDRLQELEIEIRKLRVDAKRKNAEYAAYLDEFNELFEFDTNDAFFERMRFNAQTKYEQDHPAEWEKWKKLNEVVKPTSEWYEELASLYEARAEIYGSDPEIADLMQQRRDILSPYKIGGRIKPQFMNQADIDALSEIDANIETVIERNSASGTRLTAEQKKASREITDQINKISSLQLSDSYNDTFELKLKSLFASQRSILEAENALAVARTSGDKKVIEEAEKDVIFYEEEFEKAEVQFESWYNMHHDNKYVSVTTGYDIMNNRVPKSYNFEKLPAIPVRDKYMETVPHPKYKIKRLKESAKNQDFLKSPDGVPMPKAISLDSKGNYIVTPGYENSPNLNPKYKELMKDQELFSFYNDTMKMFFDLQMRTEGRKIGYQVPGFAASTVENLARNGMSKSIDKTWQQFVDKNLKLEGQQDAVANTFGDLGSKLRHRFTDQLDENLQTTDAIGAIIKYTTEAHYNIAMQNVAPQADMYIEHLEYMSKKLGENLQQGKPMIIKDANGKDVKVDMSRRKRELDNVIEILKFERRKFMYGQTESKDAVSRQFTKVMNGIFAYTSFVRIGFDVANQMKNYISGNVQAFIAAGGMDSDKYTREDFMWAKGKLYGYNGFLHNYMSDWGRVNDISDSTMLYRFFNPAQKDYLKYVSEITGNKGRRLKGKLLNIQELGYMLQDKGDTEIAVTVMYAVMNHHKFRVIDKYDAQGKPVYKLDAEGKEMMVPVHEIYIKDQDGRLVRRQDVEYTQDDENRVRNIIYSEMRRAQGNYAKADMTKFEEKPLGKLVFFFRKYLVPQFLNRFGYLRPNWEASEAAIGYWRAVAVAYKAYGAKELAKHALLGSRRMSRKHDNQMGAFLTRKVGQARRDAILMGIMVALGMMALSYVRKKDDDDEELSMLEGNAIRILWGVKGETLSMFPVGGGSSEYIRNFTTLTTYTRELEALKKFGSHAINYGLAMTINGGEEPDPAYDSALYQDIWKDAFYGRKYGAYEKGDAKIVKDLMDLSGIKNFRDLINPNYRIDQMKGKQ
jgi:hypothetical protein